MADTPLVTETQNGAARQLPESVRVDPAHPPKHTPREMQLVESFMGKNAEAMTIGEGEQAIAFFALRRLGYEPTWDDAADVFVDAVAMDPPEGAPATAPSTNSSGSVGIGA